MKKHVVIICPGIWGGGSVANVALKQSEAIARDAHVTVLTDSAAAATQQHLRVVAIGSPEFRWLRRFAHVPRELSFALAARRACRAIHARQPIDAIICHGHAVATLAALPLQRELGIAYGLVTHGDIFDRPPGTYDARLTWFYRRVTPTAYANADLVVALSPHMHKLALAGGATAGHVALLPNGIDPGELHLTGNASQAAPARCALEVLYVGRLSVEKGVDVLVDAAALMKGAEVGFHLKIAGDGPDRAALQARVAQLGLADSIDFMGRVPRAALGKLYEASHVVCVPSRSDPLPTVVLEAMAAGVAVVGSDAGGIPFMIDDGQTGMVCKSGSATDLAKALEFLASHPEQARAMGAAGRHRALTDFSWERTGSALRDALFAACERRRAGRAA